MIHKTLYTGELLDEILGQISHIKTVTNGWIKLDSSEDNKINFNDLINPGNFSFSYYENGPEENLLVPLKVVVTKEGKYIRQYVFTMGFTMNAYSRIYTIADKVFGDWEQSNIPKGISVSSTAPENPNANDLWINTETDRNIIQYYDGNLNKWVSMNPYDYMDPDIYNSSNINFENGVYKYIDDKVKTVSTGSEVSVDYKSHLNNTSIHVTKEEVAGFESKMRSDLLLTAMQDLTDELNSYIATQAQGSGIDIPSIQLLVNQLENDLKNHIKDSTKHPNDETRDLWDIKAEKDHTHKESDITLNVNNITGNININQIPEEVKERQINITSEDELLTLTSDQVHNGDYVFVVGKNGIEMNNYTSTSNISSMCYGKDKFVAVVFSSNKFMYSLDGITWTEGTISKTNRDWYSVCYGKDKFVAIADSSSVFAYSTDGITWSEYSVGNENRYWPSICYGTDKFVAVAESSVNSIDFVYSTDGITWTEGIISEDTGGWESTCYGKDKFVTVGQTNSCAYSTDGITWTEGIISEDTRGKWNSICYGKDKFVAVNWFTNISAYSYDGITWTENIINESAHLEAICYNKDKFVIVPMGGMGCTIIYSYDGINWVNSNLIVTPNGDFNICYGNKKFLCYNRYGDIICIEFIDIKSHLYNVTDDTKLGTKDAFTEYNQLMGDLYWKDFKNKPTSIDTLDLTENYTNTKVDSLVNDLKTQTTTTETKAKNSIGNYNTVLEKQDSAVNLETLIDLIDLKMRIIKDLIDKKKNS